MQTTPAERFALFVNTGMTRQMLPFDPSRFAVGVGNMIVMPKVYV